jgi:DnaJ-class molecular chaperone
VPDDIKVVLVSRRHPIFSRDGNNLHTNITISLREALLRFKREL